MKFYSINNKIKINGKHGFTLVETLVAVSIFSVSIAAIISVVANGVGSTITTKNKIVGNYLVQENIEYIRHLRNKYSTIPGGTFTWSDFLGKMSSCSPSSGGSLGICAMPDTAELNPIDDAFSCLQANCEDHPVYYDDNGYYFQSQTSGVGTLTAFRRYFTFVVDPDDINQVNVTATVVWLERNNIEKSVSLSETLTNWIPQ